MKIKVVKHGQKPCFSLDIPKSIQKRNKIYHYWQNFKNQKFYDFFFFFRKEVNALLKKAKSNYFCNKFRSATNTMEKWRQSKDIGVGYKSNTVQNIYKNKLNEQFINISVPNNPYNFSQTQNLGFTFAGVSEMDVV